MRIEQETPFELEDFAIARRLKSVMGIGGAPPASLPAAPQYAQKTLTFVGTPNLTSALPAFVAAPALGSGIIVPVSTFYEFGGAHPTAVVDNFGNTYQQAASAVGASGGSRCGLWYCPKITATGAAFTVSITLGFSGAMIAAAIEVSNVGAGLAIDQLALTQAPTVSVGFRASVGPTGGAANGLLVAGFSTCAQWTTVAVDPGTGSWLEAYDVTTPSGQQLTMEVDLRGSVAAQAPSCTWVVPTPSAPYAAFLVAFKRT